MKIRKFETDDDLAEAVSDYILKLIKKKPDATLVLTSGDTPIKAYRLLAQKAKPEEFEKVCIIGLDEWVGVPGESEGSCRYIVEQNLLFPLQVNSANYTFFDSVASDLEAECMRIDQLILQRGGLDFIIVGIGLNGHIGLNEPGCSFDNYCHVSELAEMTITIGQKYFQSETVLSKGITVGLKHLLEAKTAMLMAAGTQKAEIIEKTVSEPVSTALPSTVFQSHKNGLLWLDEAAGKNI